MPGELLVGSGMKDYIPKEEDGQGKVVVPWKAPEGHGGQDEWRSMKEAQGAPWSSCKVCGSE